MRRSQWIMLMLLIFTATTSGQIVSGLVPAPPPPPGGHVFIASPLTNGQLVAFANPDEVVKRIMSFDRNSDGKVARDEVLERMEDVVTRGDTSGDGALDAGEIFKLASQPPPTMKVRGFEGSQYSFGDESGFSSRLHIEGAIEDLRLASPAKERAVELGTAFAEALERSAKVDLLSEIERLVTPDQLARFKMALERQSPVRISFKSGTDHPDAVRLQQMTKQLQLMVGLVNLNRQVEQLGLAANEKAQALAAVERFKKRFRPADTDWSPLLAQLHEILSDGERDDLRAALQRRPLVKAGGPMAFAVQQVSPVGGVVDSFGIGVVTR